MSVNDIHKRRHASDKDDLKKYLVQSNSVKTFLDGFCVYDPAVQAQNAAALKDVYVSYVRFCRYPRKGNGCESWKNASRIKWSRHKFS